MLLNNLFAKSTNDKKIKNELENNFNKLSNNIEKKNYIEYTKEKKEKQKKLYTSSSNLNTNQIKCRFKNFSNYKTKKNSEKNSDTYKTKNNTNQQLILDYLVNNMNTKKNDKPSSSRKEIKKIVRNLSNLRENVNNNNKNNRNLNGYNCQNNNTNRKNIFIKDTNSNKMSYLIGLNSLIKDININNKSGNKCNKNKNSGTMPKFVFNEMKSSNIKINENDNMNLKKSDSSSNNILLNKNKAKSHNNQNINNRNALNILSYNNSKENIFNNIKEIINENINSNIKTNKNDVRNIRSPKNNETLEKKEPSNLNLSLIGFNNNNNKSANILNNNNSNNNIIIYNTFVNHTSSNIDQKSKNIENLKYSNRSAFHSIINITKLNTIQNDDKKNLKKYSNNKIKTTITNYSSPKTNERNNPKPYLRRPIINGPKNIIDKTYSPKVGIKHTKTDYNISRINKEMSNNDILCNGSLKRVQSKDNNSCTKMKSSSKNSFNNRVQIKVKVGRDKNIRKISSQNKNKNINLSRKNREKQKERYDSILKDLKFCGNSTEKNKNTKKEIDEVNLNKRRPRIFDSDKNNIFTEISNLNYVNNTKNSFFNFNQKKNTTNHNNNVNNNFLHHNVASSNNIKKENIANKYSFINVLKPKAISQQKRNNNINNDDTNFNSNSNIHTSKNQRDAKSLTFLFKEFDNIDKSKIANDNNSLLNRNRIIKLLNMADFDLQSSKSKKKYQNFNKNCKKKNSVNLRENNNHFYKDENENEIKDNLIKNNLTMYSIYILSKYDEEFIKIGLSKIELYDKNNNEIYIVYANSDASDNNNNTDRSEKQDINNLFNFSKNRNIGSCDRSILKENKPFITEFKNNLYINFFVNVIQSTNIKFIKISNYSNSDEKISPVKEISIYHGKKKLFHGNLNFNCFNMINISFNEFIHIKSPHKNNIVNKTFYSTKLNVKNYKIQKNEEKRYSTFRESKNNLDKLINKTFVTEKQKTKLNKINSDRNMSYCVPNKIDISNNNINYHRINLNDENNNLRNSMQINCKIKKNKTVTNNIYSNVNKLNNLHNSKKNSYNKNNNNTFHRSSNYFSESNIYENNSKSNFNINETNDFDDKNFKSILNTDYDIKKKSEIIDFRVSKISENDNFIRFKKMHLILSSNYGHRNLIGLTGIEFYDLNNNLIEIRTAETIGALPKDLKTAYNLKNDNRIFENIFNGENNTDDSSNMWVTLFEQNENNQNIHKFPYIEFTFGNFVYLSKIRFFNYNKKNELDMCAKTIELFFDDKYYNTILLRQGLGDIININKDEDEKINNNEAIKSYCQEIFFPIKNEEQKYNENNIGGDKKYASFLYEQCYETPYLPNGFIIKFQFVSNYYKGKIIKKNKKSYNFIGISKVEIYDEKGNEVLTQNKSKYKILSNREMYISRSNKIVINSLQNEDSDNNIYFIFDEVIKISFIKIFPLILEKDKNSYYNTVKEIKIFCDNMVIFEGELYNNQASIILFTCDKNVLGNLNENLLPKTHVDRVCSEYVNEEYYILQFE